MITVGPLDVIIPRDGVGDELADYIRRLLRISRRATRSELRDQTGRHDGVKLQRAIDRLVELGLARVERGQSTDRGGRRPSVLVSTEAEPTGSKGS